MLITPMGSLSVSSHPRGKKEHTMQARSSRARTTTRSLATVFLAGIFANSGYTKCGYAQMHDSCSTAKQCPTCSPRTQPVVTDPASRFGVPKIFRRISSGQLAASDSSTGGEAQTKRDAAITNGGVPQEEARSSLTDERRGIFPLLRRLRARAASLRLRVLDRRLSILRRRAEAIHTREQSRE